MVVVGVVVAVVGSSMLQQSNNQKKARRSLPLRVLFLLRTILELEVNKAAGFAFHQLHEQG